MRFDNVPVPQAPLPPQTAITQDDPFALHAPAERAQGFQPLQYNNLPQDLAQRYAALPPLQPLLPVCIFSCYFAAVMYLSFQISLASSIICLPILHSNMQLYLLSSLFVEEEGEEEGVLLHLQYVEFLN